MTRLARKNEPCVAFGSWRAFASLQTSAIVPSMLESRQTAQTADVVLDQLLAAVRQKNRRAFEEFYDATVQRIYGLALRITRQHETAEEVVSDVYLQVWRQVERYDASRGNVMAWLTVLCRSRALDAMRRNKPAATHETTSKEVVPDIPEAEHPQNLLIAIEEQTALHNALLKLSEQQRQLLALAYFRGYSHHQLAQFTGLPVGTVKTRLRRTLQTLRELLSGNDETLGELI